MTASTGPLPLGRLPVLLAGWRGLSREHRLLERSYIACLCSMFLFHNNTVPQSTYYAVVLPLAALSGWWFARRTLRLSVIFWAATVYLCAIGLSSLGQPSAEIPLVLGYFRRTAMVLSFLLATAYLVARSRQFLPAALVALSAVAAASALISIAALLYEHGLSGGVQSMRLMAAIGFPGYENSTNIALTYAVLLVGAVGTMLAGGLSRLQHRVLLAAAVVLSLALLMAQSRGPLAAAVLGILALALGSLRWRLLLWFVGASIAGCVALAAVPDLREAVLSRGESFRPELWRHYLLMAADRPWLGYGVFTDIRTKVSGGNVILHPHNLLLSAEIRGGALAGLSMIVLLAAAFIWAIRLWLAKNIVTPFGLILTVAFAGTVDYELFSTSPAWPWVTLWLPIGICLGAEMSLRAAAAHRRFLNRDARARADHGSTQSNLDPERSHVSQPGGRQ
jgi:O-antigen ligase